MPEIIERGDVADFLASVDHEDEHFEAKSAANNIPWNAWETMSAFANTGGGVILFGVSESSEGFVATGVADAERLKQDLHTGLRDRRRISHEVADNRHIWVESIDGRDVLVMVVPEANRANKPVYLRGDTDLSYFRRGEGDVECDANELKRLLRESQQLAADSDVIDYLDFSDLDSAAVRRYRQLCAENASRHLQGDPDDREFLRRIGVWRHDRESGRRGLTRGGVLMLGDELAIRELRPNHVIDYRLEDNPSPGMRWRDRVRWTGHLFGAWEEISPRLVRSLPVPFRLSGTTRKDDPAGEETVREALINLLIHTDYIELSDARIIVTSDGFLFENPGSSRVPVESAEYDAPDHFPPTERRNPLLSSLFAHINQAELAGSGVRSMRNEWRSLGFQLPRFSSSVEDYRFSVFLSLRSMIGTKDREWLESIGGPWTENEEYALLLARDSENVDNQQLREIAGLHPTDATRVLQGLRDKGALSQNGYGKGTYYSLAPLDGTTEAVTPPHKPVTPPHKAITPPHTLTTPHSDTEGHEFPAGSVTSDRAVELTGIWEDLIRIAEPIATSKRSDPDLLQNITVALCALTPLHRKELMLLLNRSGQTIERVTTLLVKEGRLRYMLTPAYHANQKYVATTEEGDD